MFAKLYSYIILFLIAVITIIFALSVIIGILLFGKRVFFSFSKYWSKSLLFISNIKVQENIEVTIDKNKSYIYIPNHSSLFDIPVLLSSVKGNTLIMYKEELERIPFFGWCLKLSPFISVKREDKENSLEGFKQALNAINTSDSVIIFPEGTRSTDGSLGEFKKGAFLLAMKSGKEIIPVAIKGTNTLMSKGNFNFSSGDVSISYLQAINTKNNPDITIKSLMSNIRDLIHNKLTK
ncbi:MAG TPA: lysophospholipid acyltransferase family protein [Candidatus Kapabacteria bacterium]|nr:lysophospholipid acyltransferase family protein [Candidatus Kapabacteria bacterium]